MISKSPILDRLGIYGVPSSLESAILACIVSGEPGLFIGKPGTGKTEAAACIAEAITQYTTSLYPDNPKSIFKYHIYDASKLMFEDLLGFPDVKSIVEGDADSEKQIKYIGTPATIWDKDLVIFDELNRCAEERQSNLFEIYRGRRCGGMPTNVKFIFGAMNPFGDVGTTNLSEALVDRNMFYLYFPTIDDMKDSDKLNIIKRVGNSDGIGFRFWEDIFKIESKNTDLVVTNKKLNDIFVKVGKDIIQIIEEACKITNELNTTLGNKIATVVSKVADRLHQESKSSKSDKTVIDFSLSGRRQGLIYRGIMSLIAVETALVKIFPDYSMPSINTIISNGVLFGMPHGVSGKLKTEDVARATQIAVETVTSIWKELENENEANIIDTYKLFYGSNPLEKFTILISKPISTFSALTCWNRLINDPLSGNTLDIIHVLKKTIPNLIPKDIVLPSRSVQEETKDTVSITLNEYLSIYKSEIETFKSIANKSSILTYAFNKSINDLNSRVKDSDSAREAMSVLTNLIKVLSSKLTVVNIMAKSQ